MKCYRASARALVEREFNLGFAQAKDDNKEKCYRASARALVARNLRGALLLLKGAVK